MFDRRMLPEVMNTFWDATWMQGGSVTRCGLSVAAGRRGRHLCLPARSVGVAVEAPGSRSRRGFGVPVMVGSAAARREPTITGCGPAGLEGGGAAAQTPEAPISG